MAIILIGWIVRTETAGRHRYWKVGEVNADRAAQIARNAAIADVARAVTRLPAHVVPAFQIAPGTITEIVWETKPVAGPFQMSASESRIRGSVAKVLGEITFDIVVPEDGKIVVEGCYRIDGGNWQVYIFAKQGSPKSILGRSSPHVRRDAVFSSGILGVCGIVPASSVLNKKTVMGILAETLGVDEWTEVIGLDSLTLK